MAYAHTKINKAAPWAHGYIYRKDYNSSTVHRNMLRFLLNRNLEPHKQKKSINTGNEIESSSEIQGGKGEGDLTDIFMLLHKGGDK
jgi:hypothetical protein